jgi:hypothetical protein
VHLVVKAVSEQGLRLHTTPATLREWRREFAKHLREQGIAANATERVVRGETRKAPKDGIYRASVRGESTHVRTRAEAAALEVRSGKIRGEPGRRTLVETRRQVENGWRSIVSMLAKDGHRELAGEVQRFVDRMQPARTEHEGLRDELMARAQERRSHQRTHAR